jgi:hypothetical protein
MADKELDKVIKAMTAFTETQVINLSLDIHGELIEETPVDTGLGAEQLATWRCVISAGDTWFARKR